MRKRLKSRGLSGGHVSCQNFFRAGHGCCSSEFRLRCSVYEPQLVLSNFAHSSPRCEGCFPPTTRNTFHQPHSKPTLPGSAFFCAHHPANSSKDGCTAEAQRTQRTQRKRNALVRVPCAS